MCSEFQGQCPGPAASGSSQPCVVSCGPSRVVIFPPPVLVTFPGPILSTCPQETVLGSSGTAPGSSGMVAGSTGMGPGSSGMVLVSSGMLAGGAGTSLSSHGAPIPRSGGFVPKSGPRRARRCSYIFNSHWIHPCRRSGGGKQQPAGNGSEEQIPELEKPGTEKADVAKEEKEVLEV